MRLCLHGRWLERGALSFRELMKHLLHAGQTSVCDGGADALVRSFVLRIGVTGCCCERCLSVCAVDQASEGHLVDALVPRGDEGRDTLRKAMGSRA